MRGAQLPGAVAYGRVRGPRCPLVGVCGVAHAAWQVGLRLLYLKYRHGVYLKYIRQGLDLKSHGEEVARQGYEGKKKVYYRDLPATLLTTY